MEQLASQNELLLNHLKTYGNITVAEGFLKLGISSLPRRILDLKDKGIIISYTWIEVIKKNGQKAKVKKYIYSEENFKVNQ